MPRRMGRPGLVGTMARTAVVAGTATAVSGNVARRQQARAQSRADQEAAEQETMYAQQAAYTQPAEYAQQAAPAADDLTAQLERLSSLKTAGVISEAEFAAAKAKLLGI